MPNPVLTQTLEKLVGGEDLRADEASSALLEIMEGRSSEAETAAFLVALRAKVETLDEVVGLARTMRLLAIPVKASRPDLLDTAGTGGGPPSFNVSTTAAFVAAGAGCAVAKHGNRSSTGTCGSADVLEALGARIDLEPAAIAECIDSIGFGFMFAPLHHQAMKHVVPVRKSLAIRTVFNFLGPLTNPAGATRQMIGVSGGSHLEAMARALESLGGTNALVLSADDGFDEVSAHGVTHGVELRDGTTRAVEFTPESLGVEPVPAESFGPGDPGQNAEITRSVLSGKVGPERTVTLVNAAAAIYVAGAAESVRDGVDVAAHSIDSGAAEASLARFVEASQRLAPAEAAT
ncbi:MAG: anthranilate phosphoribosyltransferase [Thermoleophilaceae bacterium]|nr:anthranilate phosphoribosyltransferase [Thermoleophilaceae bacterium]